MRSGTVGQPLFQRRAIASEGVDEHARVDRVGPHHQRVLAVVAVVAAANAHLLEGVLAIEGLGYVVRLADLKRQPTGADAPRGVDHPEQQQLPQAGTAILRMDRDRGDVGLVRHEPEAGVADDPAQLWLRAGLDWLGWRSKDPREAVDNWGPRLAGRLAEPDLGRIEGRRVHALRDVVVRHTIVLDLLPVGLRRPGLAERLALDHVDDRYMLDSHRLDREAHVHLPRQIQRLQSRRLARRGRAVLLPA